MTCEPWDVVVVPFPFVDAPRTKRRPALVLTTQQFNAGGHTILCMITSSAHSPWPSDSELKDLEAAGLAVPCRVRLKWFTLDNRLMLKKLGRLSLQDQRAIARNLRDALGI